MTTARVNVIEEDAAYFDRMMNLIPSNMYLPPEVDENQWKSKYMKNKHSKAPKQNVKESSKKGKRAKFDANQTKTTVDAQEEHAKKNSVGKLDDAGRQTMRKTVISKHSSLRERLRARIAKLKQERLKSENGSRRKSNEKNRRRKSDARDTDESGSEEDDEERSTVSPEKELDRRKPAESSSMLFQTFEIGDEGMRSASTGSRKKKKSNLRSLLAKAESQRKLAQELRKSDPAKLKEQQWDVMVRRAEGDKVRDDPKRLKKAIKRKERSKRKSTAEWRERTEALREEMSERQETRNRNLQGKRTRGRPEFDATETKRKKDGESSPRRSGFEGRQGGSNRKRANGTPSRNGSSTKPKKRKAGTPGRKKPGFR